MLHESLSHHQTFLSDVASVPTVLSRLGLITLIQDGCKKKRSFAFGFGTSLLVTEGPLSPAAMPSLLVCLNVKTPTM